jgi:hypothetical protein
VFGWGGQSEGKNPFQCPSIIRFLVSRPDRPFPVLMQEELISHKGHLKSTSAGQEMNRQLDERMLWAQQTHQIALLGRAERSL